MRFVVIACVASIALVAPASAHAVLDHAEPRVGGAIENAPRSLTLWFTGDIEPAFSGATVTDDKGRPVGAGPAQVDGRNRMLMKIPVKALGPGTYHVNWHVLSVDTHRTEGSYAFTVLGR